MMLWKLFKKNVLLCCVILFCLAGCNSPLYDQTEGNVADVKEHADAAREKSDATAKPQPALLMNQGLYVDKTPINLAKAPVWLKNKIILRGEQLPFSYYSRTVVGGGGRAVLTHYQTGLDEKMLISINYSGSVQGALDLLAAKTGYVYSVNGNNVYWQAFITKSFDIAFMPGSSDYLMGKSQGSSGGGGNNSSGTTTGMTVDDTTAGQYSNFKGSLSVWKDLEDSIKQILSPDGKVMVSQATTSVVVRDRPSNVALVSRFVANLNNRLSKQVLVKVQVLEVELLSDFNYGIDWNIVGNAFGNSQYTLKANYGTPIAITPLTGEAIPQAGLNLTTGQGVGILVKALEQQGKVSVVTEPRVVCLNNQVSVIRIVESQGYLASVENTTSMDINGNSVTSDITPGTVVTGLTLYVLPKILGEKIFLQVNADLSTNLGIQTISSTQGTLTSQPAADSTSNIIQVPNVSDKQFNQRSLINSGDTLILSGYRKIANTTGAMQLFHSQALGGKGADQQLSETVVLITPILLNGSA